MKQTSTIAAAFLLSLAATAWAETPMQDGRGQPSADRGIGAAPLPGVIGGAAAAAGVAFDPATEHVMTGTITDIDKTKGTLALRTPQAELDLHFPPSALQDLNEGDQIAVKLSLSKDAAAAAGTPMPIPGAAAPNTGAVDPNVGSDPESNAGSDLGTGAD